VVLTVGAVLGAGGARAGDVERLRTPVPPPPSIGPPDPLRPVLHLAWLDVSGIALGLEGIARSETDSVFGRTGVTIEWRRADATEPARPREVRVVLLDRLLVDPGTGRPILGATPATSRTYPVVWIHLPGVRATLRLPPRSRGRDLPPRERRDLGLAVGRVVAHEVVHAAFPELSHGRGLMSKALTRRELTAPRIDFEPGLALVFQAAQRGIPGATAPESAVLAVSGETEIGTHARKIVH